MDTTFLTSMMKTHVKLMQKQLEDGFGLIANKMNQLEDKLNDNDGKIKQFDSKRDKEIQEKAKADKDNKILFQRLQEAIVG